MRVIRRAVGNSRDAEDATQYKPLGTKISLLKDRGQCIHDRGVSTAVANENHAKTLTGLDQFATQFPDITVATDVERRDAINRLKSSSSFERTHSEFVDLLADAEVDELFDAGISNSQIAWIGTGADVSSFYRKIVEPRIDKYPQERQKEIMTAFGLTDKEEGTE